MTTTAPAPPATAAPTPAAGHSATRRTLLALLACALGAIPLKALLADNGWLAQAWAAMAIVIIPAALLRLRRPPSALDIWPGVILLVPWLTLLYVRDHAWGGFVPTRATLHDVSHLMSSLHQTTSDEVAPIHSTVAVRLVLAALLGLLAALIDLIAVVGHRGALAGVPLLVVYTVSGAVPRSPVAWVWFSFAAVGYLILLGLDAADEVRNWGRRVTGAGTVWRRQGLAFSAQRIGVIAIVVAVILPVLVPAHPRNLIADLFHNSGGGGLGSLGARSGGSSVSPFVELKGELQREHPVELMKVHVDGDPSVEPFYLVSDVLDRFTGTGWAVGTHGLTQPINGDFATVPTTPGVPTTENFQAVISVSRLTGSAPIFRDPRSLRGVSSDSHWSPADQVIVDGSVRSGDEYVEDVAQPAPTVDELKAAPPASGEEMSHWLELPTLPDYVTSLVSTLTASAKSPYEQAFAIFHYFADPKNRFVYSLRVPTGDSGNELVDFLQHRTGFCQQYAAAMAVMLRAAGVPSRVVIGYMHSATDGNGNFAVSTFDAHAWVEAYFQGIGWIPFDPTPTAGLAGGKKTDLVWAPHSFGNGDESGTRPTINTSAHPSSGLSSSRTGPLNSSSKSGGHAVVSGSLVVTGLVLLLLLAVALTPAAVRGARRRRRLAAARRGDADALWAELSDTAVDLGYVWSPARSPRQVSTWLAPDAADTAPSLKALAAAVEQQRFAAHPEPTDPSELTRGLQDVTDQLWSRRSGKVRLRARLWPASLGWGTRTNRVLRRKH